MRADEDSNDREQPESDALPPFDAQAEGAVIGCILLGGRDAMAECLRSLPEGAACFYDTRHRTAYQTLLEMDAEGDPIDKVTILSQLRSRLVAQVDLEYIIGLAEAVPSGANLQAYIGIVRDRYRSRRVAGFAVDLQALVREGKSRVDVMEAFEEGVIKIRSLNESGSAEVNLTQTVGALVDRWEAAARGEPVDAVGTGFYDFDRMTGGLRPGQLCVVGARPGAGKTSFGLAIIAAAAFEAKVPTLFFSLEMGGEEILERLACIRARVDSEALRRGNASEEDLQRMAAATAEIVRSPLRVIDRATSLAHLCGLARGCRQRYGIRLIVIDYLGFIRCGGMKRNRYEEITEISNGLKSLAKELGLPIVALAQLNRDSDREDREPRLSDLRDSGSIEQDADIVGLLYPDPQQTGYPQQVRLIVAKHRAGRTGVVRLLFARKYTRFYNLAPTAE